MLLLGIVYVSADTYTSPVKISRIALLGDSMTWIGGDSCQNHTGWTYFLKKSGIAERIDVYARSGATWTNTASTRCNPDYYTEILHDDNVIYNQAIRLIKNADITLATPDMIVLFAGANDAWFADRRPGIFDNDIKSEKYTDEIDPSSVTTLEGSVRLVFDVLKERFPKSILLFVTPLQMSKTDAETIFKVSDIIEKAVSNNGSYVIRADKESGITHKVEAESPTFTYDGVHTNPEGARLLGDYLLQHLISLQIQQ